MNFSDGPNSAPIIKLRLAECGFLADEPLAASVAAWASAPEAVVVIQGPPGSGKLTLAESYAQALGLRLCNHSIGITGARDWEGSDLVVFEDAARRLAQAGPHEVEHVVMPERPRQRPADELKELIAGRRRSPGGPTPLLVLTATSAEEAEALIPLLGIPPAPATTTLPAPDRERQAAVLAHRIPGCPARLIADCLALADEIESANVLERLLSLRDLLQLAKLLRAGSATSITGENFDTALVALPKTRGEFINLSAARPHLLAAVSRRRS